jgi:plastocyanin
VAFDNRDTLPHNLQIADAGGKTVFTGEIVTGPAVKVYSVPALAAGTYPFICQVHPAMTGTLTVK